MININLLPPLNVLTQREIQLRKDLTLYIGSIGIVILIFLVFLTVSNGIIGYQNYSMNKKKNDLLVILKSHNDAAVYLRTVQDKIKGIKLIRQKRVDFGKMTGDLIDLTTPNAKINSFSVNSTGECYLSLSSPSLITFSSFIDKITSEQTQVPFKSITLSGVRERGPNLEYSLLLKYIFSTNDKNN
ncbi:hypothetical protein HY310_00105 [Candidatus Microgenomates bacterium]|nr:hypothetical protein [Candidatus Microgenomates bacterium]